MQQWQEMIGKTIKSIDESCVNSVKIEFEDEKKVIIWSECGSGDFAIPFFVVESVAESK